MSGQPQEEFYLGAADRILRSMAWITAAGAVIGWAFMGPRFAAGVVAGGVVMGLSFYWLKRTVAAVAAHITQVGARESTWRMVLRLVGRYLLVGTAFYVIFSTSFIDVRGFFAGLFTEVAALFWEAAREVTAAYARRPEPPK